MKNWLKELKNLFRKYWWAVVIAASIVAAGALISVFSSYWLCRYILNFFDDWSIALSAGAAVILALAAFLTIRNSNEREKRRREEDLLKEKRDRDAAWLNDIIDWAEEVAVCAFSVPYSMMIEDITGGLEMASVEQMVRRANITTYTNFRLRYQTFARKSKHIENIASSFPGNLDSAVRNLSKKIDDVVRELRKCAKDPDDRDRSKYKNLIKAEELLYEQADILIEEAVKIKTRDIG